jgi:NitT/TauT family transport system substrate-binding protein
VVSLIRFIGAFLIALGVLAASNAGADPVKLRIAWVASPPELGAFLFAKPGLARHEGQSYTLEATRYQGTPPMITALATGELDLAPLGYSTFATAIENAGMSDLRIVADEFQDGVADRFTGRFLVLKDSPIKTVEDLKGQIIATNGIGSGIDVAMRAMLQRHNLQDRRDYTAVETAFANMKSMLLEKKVGLIMLGAGFAFDPAVLQSSRILFTIRDAMGGPMQQGVWCARAGFLAKNHAAVVDFFEDELRALRWYSDPANREEALAVVMAATKLPRERIDPWLFTKNDLYRDPAGMPNLAAIQSNIAIQRSLGLLKTAVDPHKYADLSFVTEAAKRLQ